MQSARPDHPTSTLTVADAQRDMRVAYLDGAPGMFVSACVWAIAGLVCLWQTPSHAVWTLFGGGMLIHPLSIVLTRALGRTGRHSSGNPLATLAMATTVWMLLGLALAYGISLWRMSLFFPAMMFVIGGRYMTFATIYGRSSYWVCGAALAAAAYGLAAMRAAPATGAFAGAAIEAVFAGVMLTGVRGKALQHT